MECMLLRFPTYIIGSSLAEIVKIQFSSVRFGSVRFGSVRFGSVRFGSVRLGSVQFSSVQFSSVQFSSVQFYFTYAVVTQKDNYNNRKYRFTH